MSDKSPIASRRLIWLDDKTKSVMDRAIAREQSLPRMLMTYIVTGLVFMLLPGTFLGVWNLIKISSHEAAESISPAWIQAHGHAQLFGPPPQLSTTDETPSHPPKLRWPRATPYWQRFNKVQLRVCAS
jgi:hypothetical protein